MSNLTVCRECDTPNTPGSKFCNNCGARLPLGTNLICPNCETPNPRNRVFCDNCGTRLVKEKTPKVPGKPEEPASSGTKAFSLPARPPGDTGELDPNTLPDWLKTGDTGSIDSDHPADEQSDEMPDWLKASLKAKGADPDKLPRLEELTPEKRTTDDLPDWLVSAGDTSPIINSPKEISTEIYLDLVNRAEDTSDADEPFDANEANLPDWLAEADSFPDIVPDASNRRVPGDSDDPALGSPTEPEPVDDAQPLAESPGEADDYDLSEGLADPDTLAQSPPAGEAAGHSGLTDWLTDPDAFADSDEADSADDAGLTDWLVEAEDAAGDSDSELADSAAGSGLTDWLSEPDSALDADATDAQATGEAELADWLADLEQLGEAGTDEEEAEADISFEETAAASPTLEADDAAEASPPETDLSEPLPDWLADGDTFVDDDGTEEEFDDLYGARPTPESDLAWLAAEPDETSEFDDETTPEPDQPMPTGDLGWLDELATFDSESPAAGHMTDAEEQSEAQQLENIPTSDEPTATELSEPEPTTLPAEPADAWLASDSFSQEDPLVEEELPDWLEQLGPPVSGQPPDSRVESELPEEPLLPSEDLPDWIASLRPNSSLFGSSLPSALPSTSPPPEPLQDIPEELAGAELPEWLQDLPISETPATPPEEGSGVPGWLIEVPEGHEPGDVPAGQEWDNILGDLPPAAPLEQTLAKADIPDWVQALKPRELLTQPPVAQPPSAGEPGEPEQASASGPLAGMQGMVAIEPVILTPRTESAFYHMAAGVSPTPAQQQQAALLRQLTRSEPGLATAVVPQTIRGISPPATSLWLRLLLVGILIATILLGLLAPDLVAGTGGLPTAPAPASVEPVYAIVEAAAGRPVLLAFDYTPALAGELTPHANLLLAQLEANDSTVLTVSQYAAGTAVAAASIQAASRQDLGYLAGEAVGLRQLGNCLSHQITCETLPGWARHDALQPALSDVALIIVLTGEHSTLVNWIEQVGTSSEIPMVAAITQALAPVAAPYVASGQLEAVLAGTTAATVYEEQFGPDLAGGRRPLAVQPLAQIVVAALLLIGSLLYGISGAVSKRSARQTKP